MGFLSPGQYSDGEVVRLNFPFRSECLELGGLLLQHLFVDDRVAAEDAGGTVADQLHGHCVGDPDPDEIAGG